MGNVNAPVKQILIVGDEPAICNLCCRVLTEEGFEADITNDGEAAQGQKNSRVPI